MNVFAEIYRRGAWGNGSGPGSSPARTKGYRKFLACYIRANGVRSIFDVGCGDWQSTRLMDLAGIDYHGIDIVRSVITRNQKRYASGRVRFSCMDAVTDPLPDADMVVIKDVLQHLSFKSIAAIVAKLRGRTHVLVTHDYSPTNIDCDDGGYRGLNLRAAPFSLDANVLFDFEDADNKKTWGLSWQR